MWCLLSSGPNASPPTISSFITSLTTLHHVCTRQSIVQGAHDRNDLLGAPRSDSRWMVIGCLEGVGNMIDIGRPHHFGCPELFPFLDMRKGCSGHLRQHDTRPLHLRIIVVVGFPPQRVTGASSRLMVGLVWGDDTRCVSLLLAGIHYCLTRPTVRRPQTELTAERPPP